jgi:uncharacterized protein (DUF1330 family)
MVAMRSLPAWRRICATASRYARHAGPVTGLLLGEVEELWDMVAMAHYPSLAAMRAMVEHPDYQAIAVHRTAGLAGQLNIKMQDTLA